ncbi:hypothetical protein FCK90_08775 [Kocuria coralli]|uniref:Uncharacterized protein n=1 Tax=Kocuria coralli TaxID=1461025 RepID=A0A5J5KW82_9MICC|nr:hypothetical protein [Kocuria coralli]KAA9394007.1 hypothetical protein FCK90_08775 [Kocuria coralli]
MHEHPRGSLVDVLGHRHEGGVRTAQGSVDGRVVEAVAGDSIDLVDDAVSDRIRGDVVEHFLQRAPARGLRGLARLDELLDDDRAELFGFALRGFTLRRDRQALFLPVAGGLVLGGDPQIGDRRHQPLRRAAVDGLLRRAAGAGGKRTQGLKVHPVGEVEQCHGVTAFQKPNAAGIGG